MGAFSLKSILTRPGVRIAAICDVDETRLKAAEAVIIASDQNAAPRLFKDFRDLNRMPELDAVVISTPDHWHALQAIDAMQNGKDCYIEKPLTLFVEEGQRLCDVAQATGRITQTGSQQRSAREFRYACELIRNGVLGDISHVKLQIPPNNRSCKPANDDGVPAGLDYDMWLGPAPLNPYHPSRSHYDFRFISDYSGGQMTNWGAHEMDIVHWALRADEAGPERVEGSCTFSTDGIFDSADNVDVRWIYPGNVQVRCRSGLPPSCEFVGSKGSLFLGRGHLETEPPELMQTQFSEQDERLYISDDHMANFLECIRTREATICPVAIGHRSATACHIANIALRLGRSLAWDAVRERFSHDEEANAMLSRPLRPPWSLACRS